jgi:thermostable 8-oxoguanine DNA glycosylase
MRHRILVTVYADEEMDTKLASIVLEEYYDLEQIINQVEYQFGDAYHNIDIQIWYKDSVAV